MLKSPNEVLQHFIDALNKETQLKFDMDNWYSNPEAGGAMISPHKVTNVCGTSACIAGTVAFQLDPKSTLSASTTVLKWVGVKLSDPWGSLNVFASDEEVACDESLDRLFTVAAVYDSMYLEDVTKEDAIKTLSSLVSEEHTTWKSLLARLQRYTE